ncbi:hypothetical protein GQX73_g2193 [Xylaria multiplex]|uniref:Rhodopsin domain-containing protein n=1 Tax=Xylaria multiplex TaxID=323545 RepID=A0A7C8MYK2_9PEZI|nr:hypothetical protein GQX73_g2193 [Xylaria multiplex]
MSSSMTQRPLYDTLHVTERTFVGAIWGGAAFAFIFVAIRLYSRFTGPRRLFWDDGFIIFAWTLSLLSAILWHFVSPYLYAYFEVTSGLSPPGPLFVLHTEQYYTGQLIVLIFFYTGLWSVKFSFLMFFRRLGKNVDKRRYLWWAALAVTIATYLVCIGTIQYKCLARPLEEIIAHCSSDTDIDFTLITLKVNTTLDVLTDVIIMTIPISLIWNVQIRLAKKLALIGIFSLVLVTISFAILGRPDRLEYGIDLPSASHPVIASTVPAGRPSASYPIGGTGKVVANVVAAIKLKGVIVALLVVYFQ